MCGVAGLWHLDQRPVDGAALRRMTRALTHRGPDEEGYHQAAGIGLGHRRLSIIDLSTGQQPLGNEDDSIWVAFNGEIFNYLELRADLEKRGHRFKTRSDTETLVHLYEEKGLDFVDDLNGQFAIALWDGPRRRLVLARDRVGIRPMFHATLADGTVLFGSEMKALLAHGGLRAEIDPAAVGQIATFWVSLPPRTPFKGIEELGPGRMLVLENGRRTLHQYWQHRFPREHEYEEKSIGHWQDAVRELLHDAVRLQLRSDVPVATYLSGGLDSSILTALVKRHHINDLTTFSVGFADARFDEREYQQQMVRHLQTDHREVQVGGADIGRAFTDVVWFAERPMMRTAPAPLLRLAQLVRESGIKVVLTGEGADEVFGGYDLFREDKVRRFWARSPESAWRPALLSRLNRFVDRDPKAEAFFRMFFRTGLEDTADPHYSHRLRWDNTSQIKRVFAPEFRAQMQGDDALMAELEAYLDPGREHWHPLCRAQYLEMTLFMSGYLLNSQGDRMMMGHSVEGRVPFLDHRLIELAARIPPKFKIRGLDEKHILKRAFADILPPAIASRPKQPYRAPIAACFAGDDHNLGAQLLRPEELQRTGFANPAAVGKLLHKARAGGAGLGERDEMAVATVASLQLLNHLFVEGSRIMSQGKTDEERTAVAH
ncbi:MAG TPA: asparagine synthase (glutamine-hydrolyzing) [Albitalea sp.]|uniref:asparagine synthase (glutamine-hydrolyzing) n=1 Tax=Piscinibacter sp. TaxID=1903157 RepID=UPI002ED5AEE0